jgi:DNA-binding transcriptional LysR family regulator
MHDELRELRFFAAVARTRNYSRAAEALYTSQPAVSRGVAHLEARLGTRLFDRTSRRVTLTGAGATLLPAAEEVLHAADSLHSLARELTAGTRGVIRLGIPPNVHHVAVAEIIGEVSAEHPDIEIVPSEHPTDTQVSMLERGELDIGLLREPFDPTNLYAHELLTEALVPVVQAGHRLARARSIRLEDLAGERLVTYLPSSFVTSMLETCREHGFVPSEVRHVAEASTQLALIASGKYVALLPRRTVEGTRGIVARPLVDEPVLMRTSAAWPKSLNRGTARAVAAVIDSIRSHPERRL